MAGHRDLGPVAVGGAQPPEHESATSAGAMLTHDPLPSRSAAHITLLAVEQGAPADQEAGSSAAIIAPSRAALATAILA